MMVVKVCLEKKDDWGRSKIRFGKGAMDPPVIEQLVPCTNERLNFFFLGPWAFGQ